MAIFPINEAQGAPQPAQFTTAGNISIEMQIEQGIQALGGISLSDASASTLEQTSPVATAERTVTLSIPLDEHPEARAEGTEASRAAHAGYVRREPIRRDSLKRREALLKGKEGSRRRQRWENDRLLSNPYAQPPLPSDWEVRPTHPVRNVPYYLAPLWDEIAARNAKKSKSKSVTKGKGKESVTGDKAGEAASKVPKELRDKLKKARGAKGLLKDLEEEVRRFVEQWEQREKKQEMEGMIEPDSEDEEIVFVGKNGQMSDRPSPRGSQELLPTNKLVFDSLVEDHGASFGRWLVHSIGTYYGLRTWSVTDGTPARRKAFVGVQEAKKKTGRRICVPSPLPRPLYGMV